MSNSVVAFDKKAISKRAAAVSDMLGTDDDDLISGVSGGFSVISFRGSKWRIKHNGQETLVVNQDGEAVASLKVLMLKASPNVAKTYYEGGYVEGSTDEPDCFSNDGIKPDASVQEPISKSCANCPKNAFGSRITEQGKKSKACSDVRRVAVLPEGDFANEAGGGPLLLRVPAASLSELVAYGNLMKSKGFKYNQVISRVSFDPETAYPRLKFNAVRPITDEEAEELEGLIQDAGFMAKVESILAKPVEYVEPAPQADDSVFEEPPAAEKTASTRPAPVKEAAPEPAPAPAPAARKSTPKAAPKVAPKPEPAEEAAASASEEDDDLDAIMRRLDSLN